MATIRERIRQLPERTLLIVLSLLTGLLSGLAAVVLKGSIELIKSFVLHTISPRFSVWANLVLPGVGMLLALLFVRYVVKDNISHGVTRVLHAISRRKSHIAAHNCYSSMVASSLTIGLGGSVGAEAPIVYTGAAIGSNVGKFFNLSYKNSTLLLCCGAAGAVAGIFKAPLAGVLFCVEILLFNLSMGSIVPLLLSAVTATAVTSLFLGTQVSFQSTTDPFQLINLPYYMILGLLCGVFSLYFTRGTLYLEGLMRRITHPLRRWVVGAVGLGVLIFVFPALYGEGYGSLTSLLNNNPAGAVGSLLYESLSHNPWYIPLFFFAVFLFKVPAMSLTNAGGGVGGTFGPTLFMGGVLGFVIARVINLLGFHVLPEANFALVGMAGLMAGVMQAPLTAIFLIAEITGGYELLMPLILASICSYITIREFEPYSIYTKRLALRGELLTHNSDKTVLTLLSIKDLIETDFIAVSPNGTLEDLVHAVRESGRNLFPVLDSQGHLQGIVTLDDFRRIMFDRERYGSIYVYEIMHRPPDYLFLDERMDRVMQKFEQCGAWNLPVMDDQYNYVGFVSKSRIFTAYREQLSQVTPE